MATPTGFSPVNAVKEHKVVTLVMCSYTMTESMTAREGREERDIDMHKCLNFSRKLNVATLLPEAHHTRLGTCGPFKEISLLKPTEGA